MGLFALLILAILLIRVGLAQRAKKRPVEQQAKMLCPQCGYDLRASFDRCPECGLKIPKFRRPLNPARLRDDWPLSPIEPRIPGDGEMLVRVWDAPHAMAANLFVNQLRARGIPAIVRGQDAPMQIGSYTAPASAYSVHVWSDDVDATEAVMERLATQADP